MVQTSRQEVDAAVERVFLDPRFGEPKTSLLDDFFKWLAELLDGLFGGLGLGGASPDVIATLVYGSLFLVAMGLLFLLGSALLRARRQGTEDLGLDEIRALRLRKRVDELMAGARRAHADGDLLLALRLYFFALVVGLGDQGELAYNDAWTNRELLERGDPSPQVTRELRPLVGELDSMSFGERPIREDDVAQFEGLCRRWLEGER